MAITWLQVATSEHGEHVMHFDILTQEPVFLLQEGGIHKVFKALLPFFFPRPPMVFLLSSLTESLVQATLLPTFHASFLHVYPAQFFSHVEQSTRSVEGVEKVHRSWHYTGLEKKPCLVVQGK